MREIHTEVDIEATPAEVWAVLTDFDAYPEWNPFIREAAGTLEVGEILTLHMVPGEGRAQTFTPTVRSVRENAELVWLGALRWSWLFSAEHRFALSEVGGTTRVVHSEAFRGMLVPLLRRLIDQTKRDFWSLNDALKDRAES